MSVGILNDEEIGVLAADNNLIEDFKKENIKQACYEMRAGNTFFDLTHGGKRYNVDDGNAIVFRPHQTMVIMSKEKLNIPNDILARFITKGYLVTAGFAPINTYADPGFVGNMGIIMTNTSNAYLKIISGDVIAKVEFDRLEKPVTSAYHGQHGFETGIWPIREDMVIEQNKLKEYLTVTDEYEEVEMAFGKSVASHLKRIYITERRFLFATIVLIVVNGIIIGLTKGANWLSPVFSVLCGVISNVIYAVISLFISNARGGSGKNG